MNVWLHRISHHAEASYPLLEQGFLTVGYSDFSYTEFLENTKSGDWSYFEDAIIEGWSNSPRHRYSLWRFIAEMRTGDWVVVPSWGTFSVYRIESEAKLINMVNAQGPGVWNNGYLIVNEKGVHVGDKHLDLGFFRQVSAIGKNLSRYDFADAELTSRMKIRCTTANITNLKESVQKAIESFQNNRPFILHSRILTTSRDHLLGLIQNELNPDKFESLFAWLFRRLGATEVAITSKNDPNKRGDADIIAVFEHLRTIYYIQAKHHRGVTSDWGMQQVKEYKSHKDRMDDGYSKIAWVVSTAEAFSSECIELAKENSVGLFTGPELADMIIDVGIEGLDKAF